MDVVEPVQHAGFEQPPGNRGGLFAGLHGKGQFGDLQLRELSGRVAGQDPSHIDHAVAYQLVLREWVRPQRAAPETGQLDLVTEFLLNRLHPRDHDVLYRAFRRERADSHRNLLRRCRRTNQDRGKRRPCHQMLHCP